MEHERDTTIYVVVMNNEERYSIWPAGEPIPSGWHDVGKHGTKPEVLQYIAETWKDMRPRSVRLYMARLANRQNKDQESSGAA
jgi:MbtH protein